MIYCFLFVGKDIKTYQEIEVDKKYYLFVNIAINCIHMKSNSFKFIELADNKKGSMI